MQCWTVVQDAPGDPLDDRALFARVQQLVRWHYQWLVVHDYLKTVTQTGVVDKVLLGGNKFFTERSGGVYMPLEFSAAAFRFGHTMVRAFYDYNRNFGRKGERLREAGAVRDVRADVRLHRVGARPERPAQALRRPLEHHAPPATG